MAIRQEWDGQLKIFDRKTGRQTAERADLQAAFGPRLTGDLFYAYGKDQSLVILGKDGQTLSGTRMNLMCGMPRNFRLVWGNKLAWTTERGIHILDLGRYLE